MDENITASLPATETNRLSDVIEKKPLLLHYIPSSDLISNLMFCFSAGEKIDLISNRKHIVNHHSEASVFLTNDGKGLVVVFFNKGTKKTTAISFANKEALFSCSNYTCNFFPFLLAALFKNTDHTGAVDSTVITISLTSIGRGYSSRTTAKYFKQLLPLLSEIVILQGDGKIDPNAEAPFKKFEAFGIVNSFKSYKTDFEIDFDPTFCQLHRQSKMPLPSIFFSKMSSKARDLLFYVFYNARMQAQKIVDSNSFTLKLETIQCRLSLPNFNSDDIKNGTAYSTVKTPIVDSVKEINRLYNETYGSNDLTLSIDAPEDGKNLTDYIDSGVLRVSISGELQVPFQVTVINQTKNK